MGISFSECTWLHCSKLYCFFFPDNQENGALVEDEELPRGSVDISVYLYYARSMGAIWAFAFLFLAMAFMVFSISRDFWLSKWSEAGLNNNTVCNLFLFCQNAAIFQIGMTIFINIYINNNNNNAS